MSYSNTAPLSGAPRTSLSSTLPSTPGPQQAVPPQAAPRLPTSFESFQLAPHLLQSLAKSGFAAPTEIQARAMPFVLQGRDLLASAQTGTGKTAAFVLPALQRLLTAPVAPGRGPRVLVLTPTRELAGQVEATVRQFGGATRVRSGIIVGGVSFAPQDRLLRGALDILVATPGRLIDHMGQGKVDFSRVEMFVLDEADRMLDMGFVKPVMRIASALPAKRQTLLFSATMEGTVQDVARKLLKDPARVELATTKSRLVAITQRLHLAENPEHKHDLLHHLLGDPSVTQAIVFTATKRGADRLAKRLNTQGHRCAPLHGNMSQNARNRTVESLRNGKVSILVATDVAARGIDLIGVSHVINFDLPMVAEDYIHRIGRTGRNGATGTAISLVGPQDRGKLSSIERLTGQRLDRLALEGVARSPRSLATGAEPAIPGRQMHRMAPAPQRVPANGTPQRAPAGASQRMAAARAESGARPETVSRHRAVISAVRHKPASDLPAPDQRWNQAAKRRAQGDRRSARSQGR